jgi:hypothetical protein
MSIGHVLRYHVLIPLGLFAVLLVVGVPVGTAFVVGMMAGCMSMMLMMGRAAASGSAHKRDSEQPGVGNPPR